MQSICLVQSFKYQELSRANVQLIIFSIRNFQTKFGVDFLQLNMRRKTVAVLALGIIVIGSLIFVFIYWLGETPEGAGINRELLRKEWVTAAYGEPPIRLSTPEKLRPTFLEGEGPQNMTQFVKDARSYTFSQGSALSILVNTVKYRPGVNTNLQGAVDGALYTLGQQPGVQNLKHETEDMQLDGLEGKKLEGSYQMRERSFAFTNVLLADSSHLWQVTIIHPQDDESGAAIADRIVESVAIAAP